MEKNEVLIQIGKRVSSRRKELNMTQEYLAELIGLSLQSVSCIELGKKGIRPENMVKLCQALDVTSDYILFGQRSEKQSNPLIDRILKLNDEDYELVEMLVNRLEK